MNIFTLFGAVGLVLTANAFAHADSDDSGRRAVSEFGGVCNGRHDDTDAFKAAVALLPPGGVLHVPLGRCNLTDTVVITKPLTIAGGGLGSQIYGRTDKTLFQFVKVNDGGIRDLYLGSSSDAAGVSLIEFVGSHHNRIDNVTMLGGHYGLHLLGSLLNTIVDLKTGVNFNYGNSSFFGQTAVNQTWVFAERDHSTSISSNANTFIAPSLEGGTNGILITDDPDQSCSGCVRNGEGSFQIVGGTIEGVSQTGLALTRTFHPISVTGTHFEANGVDVAIVSSSNVRLTSIFSVDPITIGGPVTRNIQISDSIVQTLTTDVSVMRFQLQNITTDLNCTNGKPTPYTGITPSTSWHPSVIYVNVGFNCT